MIIRSAKLEDLEALQQLFVDSINKACQNDYSQEQIKVWTSSIQDKERWKRKIISQYFIVAQIDEEIVGFASLENGNYIDLMYVHKDHLRKGIAQQLLDQLKQEALRNGQKTLTSDVSKTARPFFEKNGFVFVKENEFLLRGVAISNYLMKKEYKSKTS